MSSQPNTPTQFPPLDLSRWRALPNWLMIVGGVGALLGVFTDARQFAFSWLLAYMFFLSLCLGSLCLVILHHLFDAGWSVPIRRVCEQLAYSLRHMAWLWLPIGFFASKLYKWMGHAPDLSTKAKFPLFTMPGFYIVSIFCLASWWWLSGRLRAWSLKQDDTGSVECTTMMRRYSASGIFLF